MIQRLGNGAFSICEWLARLAVINMFWLLFTAAGLGLFGWAPATAAAFSVLRGAFLKGGLADQETRLIFREFKNTYQEEFFQANIVGFLLLWGGALLMISGWSMADMGVSIVPRLVLFGTASLFLLTALLLFPVRSHLNLSIKDSIRYSLLIGLANFPAMFMVMVSVGLIFLLFMMLPGVMVFYGASLPAAVVMYMSLKLFMKTGISSASA
ncbi:YesL family protein [Salibacterium sp. K-3]